MSDVQSAGPIHAYRKFIHEGEWQPDQAQELAAEKLQLLHMKLKGYDPHAKNGWTLPFRRQRNAEPPEGIYFYGGVGRGKTAMMDIFYAGVEVPRKRRTHFHAFMLDVHARIHAFRQLTKSKGDETDPIPVVARALSQEASLLCFDEFQVSDAADAMILGRLFLSLFDNGVVVVTTSNRAPDDLYQGGLNRSLFLPFIDMLKTRLDVLQLDGGQDYRLQRLTESPVFFTPLGLESEAAFEETFARLTDHADAQPDTMTVQGRTIEVPAAAHGTARFTFSGLCEKPLGTADYLEIAMQFHTVFLAGIPLLGPEKRNEARRLINLVDVLYDHNVNLICTADAAPSEIYASGDGKFEFARTESRLIEMQSEHYLASAHRT
ncbi:MAG: cell division protein ZapE [Alphaproteobacteria bacterium]|jgi:cell division protein ZapE|nr:cell division protein ZapE [Alphaproteobacteria bacterium]MBT4085660.1 cell division protein ZapE [Alphaproteobacteria bacterium]MBT4542734.1 cell division protein ZapE [Alphaproteobacteria bacterium]MBT7745860.1 cell division protein ZapE [Alphaproteobacteria bacterium]